MNRSLPLLLASALLTAIPSTAKTFPFNLDFKDATVTYSEGGNLHTVAVSALGTETKVYERPEINVGPLTFTLTTASSGQAALSYKDDCLLISNQYNEDMGSYTMTQNIYKIVWTVAAEGEDSYLNTFTLTADTGCSPCPVMSYSSSSKTEGKMSMPSSTELLWSKYNDAMQLHAVSIPDMGSKASTNVHTFCWKNITGNYSVPDPITCADFTEVRALADGTEYTYTGQAVVTWHDPANHNLWMRDGKGTGMYFRNCTLAASVKQGDKLSGTFKATYTHGFGTGFEENQINSIFTADGLPSFDGTESVEPKTVDSAIASQYYNLGEFSTEYECDYVEIQGKFLNEYSTPPLMDCIIITVGNHDILVALRQDKNNPHISNARPAAATASIDNNAFVWYPGDAVPSPADHPTLKARGLVMRVAMGLELWPLMVTAPSTPTDIQDVESTDGDATAPFSYYTLSGVRVSGTPASGLYIRVSADGTATKLLVP